MSADKVSGDTAAGEKMPRDKKTSRQRIVDAAIDIAINQGPKVLTLDKVADKCGMSKGGVMHHFKNKEALLEALLANMMDTFRCYEDDIVSEQDALLPITRVLKSREQIHDHVNLDYARILLVAATEGESLMAPIQARFEEFVEELKADESRYFDSLLLWLAADGLSFQDLISVSPFSEDERKSIRHKLIKMAESLGENTREK